MTLTGRERKREREREREGTSLVLIITSLLRSASMSRLSWSCNLIWW
jgi:hypothetical protein